jgi:hypothetical protein
MRNYQIYLLTLDREPSPYFIVDCGGERYIVPAGPGGWHERSPWDGSTSRLHLVVEAAQEKIAVMLMIPTPSEEPAADAEPDKTKTSSGELRKGRAWAGLKRREPT